MNDDFRTQTGNKGDIWLYAQVTVRSSEYYRLMIEGVVGRDIDQFF